jgi:hypothetical protein
MNFRWCLIFLLFCEACQNANTIIQDERLADKRSHFECKGVSFVAMDNVIDSSNIEPLVQLGCNWIAQMPFGYCNFEGKQIVFGQHWQWWGETDQGIRETTLIARRKGIKTMLKPQLWMDGKYTGAYDLARNEDWTDWEKDYTKFILHFASLADSLHIEMFCVGTELDISTKKRPVFWSKLIDSIKTIYNGKLVYAANWSDYQQVAFWDKIDYIGIDGYFPLSEEKTPTVEQLKLGWTKYFNEIDTFRKKIGKAVLFTEIGYKSVDQTAKSPWFPASKQANSAAQKNATIAFFEMFSDKEWFHGAFFWKWFPDVKNTDTPIETDYTPQNKPAEKVIKQWYGK